MLRVDLTPIVCSERGGGGKPSDDLAAAGDDSLEARHARRMASDNKQVKLVAAVCPEAVLTAVLLCFDRRSGGGLAVPQWTRTSTNGSRRLVPPVQR